MELESADTQKLYSIVFNYFRAVQKTFHEDWPDTTSEWGRFTDTYRSKSQLRNTNGIGALFRFLPHLYNYIVRERGLEFSAENISKFLVYYQRTSGDLNILVLVNCPRENC